MSVNPCEGLLVCHQPHRLIIHSLLFVRFLLFHEMELTVSVAGATHVGGVAPSQPIWIGGVCLPWRPFLPFVDHSSADHDELTFERVGTGTVVSLLQAQVLASPLRFNLIDSQPLDNLTRMKNDLRRGPRLIF